MSGASRHRPPSAGTAASRGVGRAGRCAGNSRTLPEPPTGLRRGLGGCTEGRDSGPSPRHGGWREQGRGLRVPRAPALPWCGCARNRGLARAMFSVLWAAGAAQPGRCCRGCLRAPRGGGSAGAGSPEYPQGVGATRVRSVTATGARTGLPFGMVLRSLAAMEAELVMIKSYPCLNLIFPLWKHNSEAQC